MKIVYISGPYRAKTVWGVKQDIRHAEEYAVKYWKLGYAVICPHMNTAHLDGVVSEDFFLKGDLEILVRCDICVMIPGWQTSPCRVKSR